jgi:hypothetical protein
MLQLGYDVDGLGSRAGAHLDHVLRSEEFVWVAEQGEAYWDWLHPQYRRVFEVG